MGWGLAKRNPNAFLLAWIEMNAKRTWTLWSNQACFHWIGDCLIYFLISFISGVIEQRPACLSCINLWALRSRLAPCLWCAFVWKDSWRCEWGEGCVDNLLTPGACPDLPKAVSVTFGDIGSLSPHYHCILCVPGQSNVKHTSSWYFTRNLGPHLDNGINSLWPK